MPARTTPSYLNFDKAAYPWKSGINYRARPKRYRVGKGEQGVLICEPYKSEIAPHWTFKMPAIAKRSARAIYKMFIAYLDDDDFVGADMARKFLQMGYTRARRYANYKGGRKYDKDNDYKLQERGDRRSRESRKRRDLLRVLEEGGEREALRRAKEGLERQYRMKLPILPVYYYQHRLPS
jgi:hypothetical protein